MAATKRKQISEPADDGGDGDNESAINKLAARVKEKARAAEREEPEEERELSDDETELEIGDGQDDDDEGDEPDERPRQRPSRERRQNNYRQMQHERDSANQELAQLRQQMAQLQGGMTLIAQNMGRGQPPPPAPDTSAHEKRIEAIRQRMEGVESGYNAKVQAKTATREDYAAARKQLDQLEDELHDAREERRNAGRAPQMTARDMQRESMRQALFARHPEMQSDRRVASIASANYAGMIARGHAEGLATWDKAASEAKRELGLGEFAGGRQPTNRQVDRSRYTGLSRGNAGSREAAPTKIVMTPAMKKMAEARYSNLPKEKAWQKWADTSGRAHLAKHQKRA
jgi:hypothetical protein